MSSFDLLLTRGVNDAPGYCQRTSLQVEVFRRLYEAVGLGWLYAATKIPAVEWAANGLYDIWAKYRLPLTGRPDLMTVLENRRDEGKNCKAEQASTLGMR
jgi:hypothetical protein